jgi:hypothetical protein
MKIPGILVISGQGSIKKLIFSYDGDFLVISGDFLVISAAIRMTP